MSQRLRDDHFADFAHVNNTEGMSSVETKANLSERAKLFAKKRKEGTEGIDAVDERSFDKRLSEGCDFMEREDY